MGRASTKSILKGFFEGYPGSEVVKNLKDGASLNVTVGKNSLTVVKRDGEIIFCNDEHEADISVSLNKPTLEFICSSSEIDELVSRVKKCVNSSDGSYKMSYRINASLPSMAAKGYLGFARRMGLL